MVMGKITFHKHGPGRPVPQHRPSFVHAMVNAAVRHASMERRTTKGIRSECPPQTDPNDKHIPFLV